MMYSSRYSQGYLYIYLVIHSFLPPDPHPRKLGQLNARDVPLERVSVHLNFSVYQWALTLTKWYSNSYLLRGITCVDLFV